MNSLADWLDQDRKNHRATPTARQHMQANARFADYEVGFVEFLNQKVRRKGRKRRQTSQEVAPVNGGAVVERTAADRRTGPSTPSANSGESLRFRHSLTESERK